MNARPFAAPLSASRKRVQSLADTAWRLDRIPALEMSIYAHGHLELADKFDHHDPSYVPGLIEFHTFLTYEKQLRNLNIEECPMASFFQSPPPDKPPDHSERH